MSLFGLRIGVSTHFSAVPGGHVAILRLLHTELVATCLPETIGQLPRGATHEGQGLLESFGFTISYIGTL